MAWIKTEENLYINLDKYDDIKIYEIDGEFKLIVISHPYDEHIICYDPDESFLHELASYILQNCSIGYFDIYKLKIHIKNLNDYIVSKKLK